MTGVLLDLVAVGMENLYLTFDPQITLFKHVYRTIINFSLFDEIIYPKSNGSFGSSFNLPLERRADFLRGLKLVVHLPEINIKKITPTFQYVSNILKSFGISWNYSPNKSTDIVTLQHYNGTDDFIGIVNTINSLITNYINFYNFFVNFDILSVDTSQIIKSVAYELRRVDTTTNTIESLCSQLTNGRYSEMTLIYNQLLSYNKNYNYVYDGSYNLTYLPTNNDYVVATTSDATNYRQLQLYSADLKKSLFRTGILLGTITHYSYDTLVYNAQYDYPINKIDSYTSSGLFGSNFQRGVESQSTIIPLNLYNADDFRYILYNTYMNNIIRLSISTPPVTTDFLPTIGFITLNSSNSISLSENLEPFLPPNNSSISDSITFYHVVDPDINNFAVYQFNIGENTKVYFDDIITSSYNIFSTYYSVLNNGNIDTRTSTYYTETDAYNIYKSYVQNVINTDLVNKQIKSYQQVQLLSNTIKYNIDNNIRYNFNEISNALNILYKATRNQLDHYIISFYRLYTYISTAKDWFPIAGTSFVPVINSSVDKQNDNFITTLNNIVSLSTPTGIIVDNFFNLYIRDQVSNFITSCQNQLRTQNYDGYTDEYRMWSRLLFLSGSDIVTTFTNSMDTNSPQPDSAVFGKIAYMNFIPFLAVKDIPMFIQDTFKTYARQILVNIGADTGTNFTNYTNLLYAINFTDSGDGNTNSDNLAIKLLMYKRIINTVMVTTPAGGSSQIINKDYFESLQNLNVTGSTYAISCSIVPEKLFPEYSIISGSGTSLTDVSTDIVDIKYLPIEWITQTYYYNIKQIITNFINSLGSNVNKTSGINNLVGLLQNIINCFIVNNNLPTYVNYKNNKFTLLGLVPETNTTFQNIKNIVFTSQVSTTSKYCDSMSSIWYQTQKKYIQLLNSLFNDTILSQTYFTDNLGTIMSNIFSCIKTTLTSPASPYYDESLQYTQVVLQSYSDIGFTSELNPPIDPTTGTGFDFFRLTVIGSDTLTPYLGDPTNEDTRAGQITSYIKNTVAIYDFTLNYYNSHKSILSIKNDNDNILFNDDMNVKNRRKSSYMYEQTSNIINYYNEHTRIKYISNSTLDSTIKSELLTLVNSTSEYWNPNIVNILNKIKRYILLINTNNDVVWTDDLINLTTIIKDDIVGVINNVSSTWSQDLIISLNNVKNSIVNMLNSSNVNTNLNRSTLNTTINTLSTIINLLSNDTSDKLYDIYNDTSTNWNSNLRNLIDNATLSMNNIVDIISNNNTPYNDIITSLNNTYNNFIVLLNSAYNSTNLLNQTTDAINLTNDINMIVNPTYINVSTILSDLNTLTSNITSSNTTIWTTKLINLVGSVTTDILNLKNNIVSYSDPNTNLMTSITQIASSLNSLIDLDDSHEVNKTILTNTINDALLVVKNLGIGSQQSSGIYGILDVIYNKFMEGNLSNAIARLYTLPAGKTNDDYIDYVYNPYSIPSPLELGKIRYDYQYPDSFCLHDWYLSLSSSNVLFITDMINYSNSTMSLCDNVVNNTDILWTTTLKNLVNNIINNITYMIKIGTSYAQYLSLINTLTTKNNALIVIYDNQNIFNRIYINNVVNDIKSTVNNIYIYVQSDPILLSNRIKYQDIKNSVDDFNAILYNDNGVPLITSDTISANKNLLKLYGNSKGRTFANASYVAWFMFDTILLTLNQSTVSFQDILLLITNTTISNIDDDKGATDTLKYINAYSKNQQTLYLSKYNKISDLKSTASTVNNIKPFYDMGSSSINVRVGTTDILYYSPPSDGVWRNLTNLNGFNPFIDNIPNNYKITYENTNDDILYYIPTNKSYMINTDVEIRLLDIINNAPPKFAWVKELGHKIIKNTNITIDGQTIQSLSAELIHLLYKIYFNPNHERGYNILIGNTTDMYTPSTTQKKIKTLYINLPYWLGKNAGNSLPLNNLIHALTNLNLTINDLSEVLYTDPDTYFVKQPKLKCGVLCQYAFVDDDERIRMANNKLEYLFERHLYNGLHTFSLNNLSVNQGATIGGSINTAVDEFNPYVLLNINLSDPIKYLIWYVKFYDDTTTQSLDIINWNTFGYNVRNSDGIMINIKKIFSGIEIVLGGVQREIAHEEFFYTNLIPYEKNCSSLSPGEYMYSFSLYPLILQPSGSANFTELSDCSIKFTFTDEIITKFKNNPNLRMKIELWGCAYNILRVISGMAGLAFFKSQ